MLIYVYTKEPVRNVLMEELSDGVKVITLIYSLAKLKYSSNWGG